MNDTEERLEVNSQSKVKASDDKKWSEYCRTFLVKDAHGSVKELVFPKALDLDRPKRERTTFSIQQLTRLEDEFRRNHYLIGKDRTAVAKRLGLTETQVKVWFQNRRTKHKKDNERQGEDKDSRAESQAAQNVLKLLEYKTVFDYTNILSQKPSDVSLPQAKSYIPKSCLECNDKTNNSLSSIESGDDALSGRCLTSNFPSFSKKLSDDCNSDSIPRVKNAPSGAFHDVTSCATWFPAHFESRPYPALSLPLVHKSESPIHSPRYNKPIWKLAGPSDKYGTFPSDSFDPLKDFRRNPSKTVEEDDISDDHHQSPDRTFALDCAFARTDPTPEKVNSALCFENHCPAGFESRQSDVDQSIFSSEHPLYDKHPGQTSNHGMHALSTYTDPVLKLTRPMITHKDKYCDTGRTSLTDTICPTAVSAKTVQVPIPTNVFSQGNSRVDQQCQLHHRQQLHKTSENSYIISPDSVSPSLHTIHQSNRSSFSDYSSSIHSKAYACKISSSKRLSPHSPVDKLPSERYFQDNQTYYSRPRPTPYNLSASHFGFVDPSCVVSSSSNMMPKFFCHPHTDNP